MFDTGSDPISASVNIFDTVLPITTADFPDTSQDETGNNEIGEDILNKNNEENLDEPLREIYEQPLLQLPAVITGDTVGSMLALSNIFQEEDSSPASDEKLIVPEKTDIEISKVEFSAVAPKTLIKGDYTIIRVIMYEESYRYVVDNIMKELEVPAQEARSGIRKVKDGSEIKITISSPDITIEDDVETGIWQGGHLDFAFAVFLTDQYKKRQVLFQASVYINGVIAAKLKFIVQCSSLLEQKISVSREDILSAFVSYASQDRKRVAAIVLGIQKARPDMDLFLDVENLRSGDKWEKVIPAEIEKRDILFLCWSHFARESKWVDAEWRYAYEQKGADCIEPIPIEPPELCPPPKELNEKHFNDRLLYIMHFAGMDESAYRSEHGEEK